MNFSWFKKQKFQSLNQDVPATSLVNEIQSNMYWCIFMVQKFNWTISSHQNADFKDIHLCTVFSAEFIWSLPTVPHIENFRQFEINCGFFQNRNQNQIEIFFGWFQVPYLLDRPGLGHHVQGEVYQVDDDMLALLGTIHILRSTCRVERVRKWKCLLIFSTKIMHRG